MTNKALEAAARVLATAVEGDDQDWQLYREDAEACIDAYLAASVEATTDYDPESNSTAEDWESGRLGQDERFVRVVDETPEMRAQIATLNAKLAKVREIAKNAEEFGYPAIREILREVGR